jgi:hypothetical protein
MNIEGTIAAIMVALNKSEPEPPAVKTPITSFKVAELSSPCEALLDEPRGMMPMSDMATIAQMTPAQIVEQSRKHLSHSFYTEVGKMPAVAMYDKAVDSFLWAFLDQDGCRFAYPQIPAAAFYAHHMGVWARSYTEAVKAGDVQLAAKCAAAASYFLTVLILGSRSCWRSSCDRVQ